MCLPLEDANLPQPLFKVGGFKSPFIKGIEGGLEVFLEKPMGLQKIAF